MSKEIVKCISCGAVSVVTPSDRTCQSCSSDDLYASIVGEMIEISCLSDDYDLMDWCEENSYDGIVKEVDNEAELVWIEGCPYAISVEDIL